MKALRARLTKIEAARQPPQQPAPLKADGIEARRHYGKRSAVPGVTIWYDSLRFTPEEAVAAIRARLPVECSIFVFPRVLSEQQWTLTYASLSETLH